MPSPIDTQARNTMFVEARTLRQWRDEPVGEEVLRDLWSLARLGPTANNLNPARIVFVTTDEARQRLRPCLAEGNIEKTMTAPVTAIIGYDLAFYEDLPILDPDADPEKWRNRSEDAIRATAHMNGTLQGAYLIMAARAVGLDCGPMAGFDKKKVDAAFFAGTEIRSNFLCNLGHGDRSTLRPRQARFTFEEACRIE
ncbi:MAG: malonic semialdehyde reductase [Rhodospirillales bacterium]